jgi:hypothetical protein
MNGIKWARNGPQGALMAVLMALVFSFVALFAFINSDAVANIAVNPATIASVADNNTDMAAVADITEAATYDAIVEISAAVNTSANTIANSTIYVIINPSTIQNDANTMNALNSGVVPRLLNTFTQAGGYDAILPTATSVKVNQNNIANNTLTRLQGGCFGTWLATL